MNKELSDKHFIIPIILLGLNFLYRLINQSKLIFSFPLDYTNDLSSYMAQLFFLAKCGFHQFCPYWYNGFTTFKVTPPGWFFFTLPIYWITNNITLSTYISIILIFILTFIAIYLFGKLHKFSFVKISAFFLFLFGNAMAIGNYIRLGRPHELFGWFFFVIIAFTCLYYKNHRITRRFYWIILPLSLIILAHQYAGIPAFIVLFSLFISKPRLKNKIKIAMAAFISLIITSFWWIPYLFEFLNTRASLLSLNQYLLDFKSEWVFQSILTLVVSFTFLVLFYFYWVSKFKSRKELLFFLPSIILAVLLATKLICFIPVLKSVFSDSFLMLFIFLSIFIFFKTERYPDYIKKILPFLLILVALVSVSFSVLYTPLYREYTPLEHNTLEILNYVDGKFLILKSPNVETSYPQAYYAYAPIYLNLSTSEGWYESIISEEYNEVVMDLRQYLEKPDCINLRKTAKYLNTTYVITYDNYCSNLKNCNFIKTRTADNVCLYRIS